MALPSGDIENLKCALCQNYLSVPPITVISENGDDHKCGRCEGIKTKVNIRMKMLENVLKFCKFPCIYKNCKEKLSWGAVEAHEEICPHKTYKCNLLENCIDVIAIDDLEAHYITKKHALVWMVHETFEKKLPFGHFGVYLFIKNKVPYLIYYNTTVWNFWISVFSLKYKPNVTTKYEVKLFTATSIMSILYENQTVKPYKEREHCARCHFKECHSPYHKFSKANKEDTATIDNVRTTIIDAQRVIVILGFGEFVCSINILDGPRTPETNAPESVTVNEPSSCNNNGLLRQILQCPICMEFMSAEIYTCSTGHVICKTCKPQVKVCPTCEKDFAGSRSYSLEEIAENVELACQHKVRGCNFIGNVASICRHQTECTHKTARNRRGIDAIGEERIKEHLREQHMISSTINLYK